MSETTDARLAQVVGECVQVTDDVMETVSELRSFFKNDDLQNRDGITLLEVKNNHLLSYMTEMAHLMLKMANGQSIAGDSSVERLVEIRTVLERIRPIEHKMKYQIDKLIKLATSQEGEVGGAKRPRPDNLVVDDREEEGSSDEDDEAEGQTEKRRKYVPPKLVAMPYDEDDNERERRLVERAKRRALNSSLLQDLRQQYSQAPEEIRETVVDKKRQAEDRHKTNYEEEMMVRLQVNKKQRKEEKQRRATSTLDNLLDFGDYMAVNGIDRDGQPLQKKAKFSHGKKGGKKMGKKKWKKKH